MHLIQTALAVMVVGFFTVLGAPLATIGIYVFLQRWYLILWGERATGKVLGVVDTAEEVSARRSTDESSALLRIEFTDCYARNHQVTTDTSASPKKYRRGDPVPLLYRSERPKTFVIDHYWMKWTIPLFFGGIGAILLIPLLIVLTHALR